MDQSKFIAGFVGPVLAAIGVAMLVNRQLVPGMIEELARSTGLIFLSGILSLLAGLAIVRFHDTWEGWPVLITVFGWLAIVGGLLRMWFPQLAGPIAARVTATPSLLTIAGLILMGLGGFLSFKSYR